MDQIRIETNDSISNINSDDSKIDEKTKKRLKINFFPVVYYTPETSLAFGAVALFAFNFKSDSIGAKSSTINPSTAYTLNNQILLFIPFNLLIKNDTYRIIGELGAYKYSYLYYGIGNNIPINKSTEEPFLVSFPRVRLSAYKKVIKNTFVGLRYNFDYFTNLIYDAGGVLKNKQITGTQGGVNSGLGIAAIYDSRDNIYYSRKGLFIDFSSVFDRLYFGSNYVMSKTTLNASYFLSPGKKSVLGFNAYVQGNDGEIPFYQLGLLGGNKRMRGLFEGRYRDNKVVQTQVEWRQEIFNNLGIAGFFGLGWAAKEYNEIAIRNTRTAYGAGVRYKLNKKEHINIRLDFGFSQTGFLTYFTIGEAF